MKERILSISVAAYNVEKYIEQCLDSFVDKELIEKIEVLVTDDGSSDSTPEIVNKYVRKYPGTFRLIVQKNAGPGSTVNSGIRNARGKYFRMVDGDDWVNTEGLKSLVSYLENNDVDMVCTNYACVDNETGDITNKELNSVQYNKKMEFESVCDKLVLEMHNVVFKTKVLQDNNITLDNGFYTDVEYLLLPTPYVKSIVFLNIIVYMYRTSLSTQSMNIRSLQKNVQMHHKVFDRLVSEYEKYKTKFKLSQSIKEYLIKRIAAMGGTQLSIYLSFDDTAKYKEETKEMMEGLKQAGKDIYDRMLHFKTFKILKCSNFFLFPLISYLHKKKIKLKR